MDFIHYIFQKENQYQYLKIYQSMQVIYIYIYIFTLNNSHHNFILYYNLIIFLILISKKIKTIFHKF